MSAPFSKFPPLAATRRSTGEDRPPVCRIFGLDILAVDYSEASRRLMDVACSGGRPATVVVTPNIDHLVRLEKTTPEFRALYANADAIFADGMPVVWASRFLGSRPLPDRITGADLFITLATNAAALKLPVFVIGGMPGQEAMLSAALAARFPGLHADVYSPSMTFEPNGVEGHEALHRIALARPAIVFVCLGMPKQEIWAIQHRYKVSASLVMCVGAAMEFALGQKRRAPKWMQRAGFEWAWRLANEPRRLWRRYLVQSLGFLRLLWRERAVAASRAASQK